MSHPINPRNNQYHFLLCNLPDNQRCNHHVNQSWFQQVNRLVNQLCIQQDNHHDNLRINQPQSHPDNLAVNHHVNQAHSLQWNLRDNLVHVPLMNQRGNPQGSYNKHYPFFSPISLMNLWLDVHLLYFQATIQTTYSTTYSRTIKTTIITTFSSTIITTNKTAHQSSDRYYKKSVSSHFLCTIIVGQLILPCLTLSIFSKSQILIVHLSSSLYDYQSITGQPSRQPSSQPTLQPSQQPSRRPSHEPTMQPSRFFHTSSPFPSLFVPFFFTPIVYL